MKHDRAQTVSLERRPHQIQPEKVGAGDTAMIAVGQP